MRSLRDLDPNLPISVGAPKGRSLASLRKEAADGCVSLGTFGGGAQPVVVSLALWADADPDATRFIIHHQRGTPLDERDSPISGLAPAVEQARQELVAAIKAGAEEEQLDVLRTRLRKTSLAHGGREATEISPWNPAHAVEIHPGVFVQDERPNQARGA